MKYIKKFNEELQSATYKSAARKLKKILKDQPTLGKAIKAEERANKLELYSNNIREDEALERWKKNVQEFSKYGEFDIEMSRPGSPIIVPKNYSFYLTLHTEVEMLMENWNEEDPNNREFTFAFCVGLIPKSVEDIREIKMNFNDDFYNGSVWGFWIYPTYTVINSQVTFKGLTIYDYDSSPSHQISDRKTAVSLKRLLVNIFDPTFDYPSSYKDITNMYDKIEITAIQGLEIASDYGVDMGRIREDIQKLPINNFYKQ